MPYPTDRKYSKEHEWIQVNGNSAAIGITHYAQESLGDIVFVETPKVGAELTAGKTFGTVESVKAVSELFTPISGEVKEINRSAVAEPGIVNDDPFGDGWLIKLKISTDQELSNLMTSEEYAGYLKEEEKEK